ncbi:MAG: hypothetical protein Kow0077_31970 [Anaerolineae bacterium]
MSRRLLTIVLTVLLLVVLALELSGAVPGIGVQTLPLLILLLAAVLVWRAVWPERASGAAQALAIPRGEHDHAALDVTFGAGELRLEPGHDPAVLLGGDLEGGAQPVVMQSAARVSIQLKQPFSLLRRRAVWRLAYAPGVSWSQMRWRLGAAQAHLDLRAAEVHTCQIEAVGTTLAVWLPASGTVTLEVSGGHTTITVPRDAPVTVESVIRLGEVTLPEAGFEADESGMRWTARGAVPDAEGLAITLKGGLGTVTLRWAE